MDAEITGGTEGSSGSKNGRDGFEQVKNSELTGRKKEDLGRFLLSGLASGANHLSVLVFVQCSELYERAIRESSYPIIEFHNDAMYGEEQVVIWLLKCLSDCIKFALVATAVI